MKKLPKALFVFIISLVLAIVILPAIRDNSAISQAAENSSYPFMLTTTNPAITDPHDGRLDPTTTTKYPVSTGYYTTTTKHPVSTTAFSEGKFIFRVYGYGHGVGMSQHGAMAMAANGDTYEKILTHYFPGTTVKADNSTPATIKYDGVDIPIVEYLCKTTKNEMGYSIAGKEALKAQMATIYTYAKHNGFVVKRSQHAYADNFSYEGTKIYEACLEYLGMSSATDTPVAKYVDYNGSAANTVYFASSAGKTASASSVWKADTYPYLNGGVSSCETVDITTKEISAADMKKYIESYAKDNNVSITLSDNPAEWLEILSHDSAYSSDIGYITEIRVGNAKIKGNAFRCYVVDFAVKSHCFTFEYVPAEEISTTSPAITDPTDDRTDFTSYPVSTTSYYPYPTTATTQGPYSDNDSIAEIYVEDVILIANLDGHMDSGTYWDKTEGKEYSYEYFRYNCSPEKITVIFKDGTTFTGNVGDVYSETGCWIRLTDNQSYSNPWTIGEYYVTAYLGNVNTTFRVKIIDTPIKDVELKPVKPQFTENVDGYLIYKFDENGNPVDSYFFYHVYDFFTAEITFKEGYESFQDKYYSEGITYDQSFDNPWGVGKHTITYSCMGFEKDFEIEIVPNTNPIKSVTIENPNKIFDEIDSYIARDESYEGDNNVHLTPEYKYYEAEKSNPVITVEYADGTVIREDFDTISDVLSDESPLFYFRFTSRITSAQSYNNQWELGKNTAYLVFFDMIVPFEVEVVPNPVSGIELIKAPDKTEYILGEYIDMEGAVIRIHYTSGDYIDVPVRKNIYNQTGFSYHDNVLERDCSLRVERSRMDELGDIPITIHLSGTDFSCETVVTFKENKVKSISLHESENHFLFLTVYNSDGTTENWKILNYFPDDGGGMEGVFVNYNGILLTDKGMFRVSIYFYHNGFNSIEFDFGPYNHLSTNFIENSEWLELYVKSPIRHVIVRTLDSGFESTDNINFCKTLTDDNVDIIALNSAIISGVHNMYQNEYDADIIKEAISNTFVVDNTELTLFENYNPINNTFRLKNYYFITSLMFMESEYENGYWYVRLDYARSRNESQYKSLYLVLNEEMKIVAFSTEEMPVVDNPYLEIRKPSETVISYGDSIVIHADATKIPSGGYVEWTASNGNFDMEVSADGSTCKITPKSNGDTTFTATLYDSDGNKISSDEQTMTSKAGIFNKIIAFFKKLFGLLKTIPQVHK